MYTSGWFFEDCEVGRKVTTMSRTVTEADIVQFCGQVGLFEELFLSEEAAKSGPYGRRIAPGALIYAIHEGLMAQTGMIHGTGMAFLGTELQVLKPTFIGDTIHVEIEVLERRESGSKPDRGIVHFRQRVINQRGETVMDCKIGRMVRRRAAG